MQKATPVKHHIPSTAKALTCRAPECKDRIYIVLNYNGRRTPVNPDGTVHHDTCKGARRFRPRIHTKSESGPTTHEIRCYPQYFRAMATGRKPFEVLIRRQDRTFALGDILLEREFDNGEYTGAELTGEITYLLHGGVLGIPDDRIIAGVRLIKVTEAADA